MLCSVVSIEHEICHTHLPKSRELEIEMPAKLSVIKEDIIIRSRS